MECENLKYNEKMDRYDDVFQCKVCGKEEHYNYGKLNYTNKIKCPKYEKQDNEKR